MTDVTVADVPKQITDWMTTFGLNARSLDKADKDDAAREAQEVATLLEQLKALPRFAGLLEKFGDLADAWKLGTECLEAQRKGVGDHKTRKRLRHLMREVTRTLKAFHQELLDVDADAHTPDGANDDLKQALANALSLMDTIDGAADDTELATDTLAREQLRLRLARIEPAAHDAAKKAADAQVEKDKVLDRRLVLTQLYMLIQDQKYFVRHQNDMTDQAAAENRRRFELHELNARIASNLEFARQAPLRADLVDKIDAFEKKRAEVWDVARAAPLDSKEQGQAIATLNTIEKASLGLMSQQAVFKQAAGGVEIARRQCDSRHATLMSSLGVAEADIARLLAIQPTLDLAALPRQIIDARAASTLARADAFASFEKAVREQSTADVVTPMQHAFDDIEATVREIRADIAGALIDADQVALRLHDLQPDYDKAIQVPASVPGSAGLAADLDAIKKLTSKAEKLARLDEFRKRCVKVVGEHEEGIAEKGGKDYWLKRTAAETARAKAQVTLAKALAGGKLDAVRVKFARVAMAEAELQMDRDDIAGYVAAARQLANVEVACGAQKLSQNKARFLALQVKFEPMIDSGATADATLRQRLDTLADAVDKNDCKDADLAALVKLHDDAKTAVSAAYKTWTLALQGAAKLAAMVRRLSSLEPDDSSTAAQRSQAEASGKAGKHLLERYEEAVGLADRGDYVGGRQGLADFVKDAETWRADSEVKAKKLLGEAGKPVGPDGQPIEWRDPTANVKDKSYGFNTTRDAMRYAGGQERAADGTLVISGELDDIGKFLDFKLQKFRELVNLGQNPLEIARAVFAPVPENFWPASAVKVVVAYRAAEQDFADERLRKEADDLGVRAAATLDADRLREKVEAAKKTKKLPDESVEKIKEQLKEAGLELPEDFAKVSEMLAVANFWQATDNFGVEEIGHFEFKTEEGDLKDFKVAGGVGEFGALGGTLIKTGMGIYELVEAIRAEKREKGKADFRARKEDEVVSPVRAKTLEYERNRAIATLVNDGADAVLNAVSAGGHIPGMNIAGDIKNLAIALYEAGRYFDMLATSLVMHGGSKHDPDSIAYLGFARQAKEEGIASGMKCFEAACKILKLTGDAVQLAGHAAPAGFAINLTSQFLELGGKACFKVYSWRDASTQMKTMARAKKVPMDYQAIAEVFSNTQKYARYCIAWGCLNDDPWARAWVVSRGLTDSDLDHPETSTQVLREYINTTQESKLGETQEADPETFGGSLIGRLGGGVAAGGRKLGSLVADPILDKIHDRDRSLSVQRFDIDAHVEATAASWKVHVDRATRNGLFRSGGIERLKDVFAASDKAALAFASGLRGKPSSGDDDDKTWRAQYDEARSGLETLRSALVACQPTANPAGASPHEGMKLYLAHVIGAVAKAQADLSAESDRYWATSLARRAKSAGIDAATLKAQDVATAAQASAAQVAKYGNLRTAEIRKRLGSSEFPTPVGRHQIASKADRAKIVKEALEKLGLDAVKDDAKAKVLRQDVDRACDTVVSRLANALSGLPPVVAADGSLALPDEFDAQYKLQVAAAAVAFEASLDKAWAEAGVEQLAHFTWAGDGREPLAWGSVSAKAAQSAAYAAWAKAVKAASDETTGGWNAAEDAAAVGKLGEALSAFAALHVVLTNMAIANTKDLPAQGQWRSAAARLRRKIDAVPRRSVLGISHDGMNRYLAQLAEAMREREATLESELRRVNMSVDWAPTKTFFDGLPLNGVMYAAVVAESVKRHLKKKSVKSASGLFKPFDKTQQAWLKVSRDPAKATRGDADKAFDAHLTAMRALAVGMKGVAPVNDSKHTLANQPHLGFTAYRDSTIDRLGDDSKGLIAALQKQHADNAAKYLAARS